MQENPTPWHQSQLTSATPQRGQHVPAAPQQSGQQQSQPVPHYISPPTAPGGAAISPEARSELSLTPAGQLRAAQARAMGMVPLSTNTAISSATPAAPNLAPAEVAFNQPRPAQQPASVAVPSTPVQADADLERRSLIRARFARCLAAPAPISQPAHFAASLAPTEPPPIAIDAAALSAPVAASTAPSEPPAMVDQTSPTIALPPSLSLDSALERQLQSRKQSRSRDQDTNDLTDRIYDNLCTIRRAFEHPYALASRPPETDDQRYAHAVIHGLSGNSKTLDDVLRYCLAASEGKPALADAFKDDARRSYLEKFEQYNWILGEQIPSGFHDTILLQLETREYFQGEHSTAADEFDTFWRLVSPTTDGRSPLVGLSTGISALDDAMLGLRGITILGGDKGVGKTSLAINFLRAALLADVELAALVFSLDMDKTSIYLKLLCCEAGLTRRELFQKNAAATESDFIEARKRLGAGILKRLQVVEWDEQWPKQGMSLQDLKARCRRLRQATGASRVLIVIDLLQRMHVPPEKSADNAAYDYRLDLLAEMRSHTQSSKEPFGLPMLVLSELRKTDAAATEPRAEDLRGSNRISYVADNILLLSNPASGFESGAEIVHRRLRIDKTRDGVKRDIDLDFDHLRCRFTERSTSAGRPSGPRNASGRAPATSPIDPLAG